MRGISRAPSAEALIVELLRREGPADRGDLARFTGLSPATVSRALERLREAGFVAEVASDRAGVGRPPRRVELRPDRASVVGIDAGGSMLRAVLAGLEGSVRRRAARPASDPSDPERLVDDLVSLVGEVAGRGAAPVLAVAAGISGIVDHDAGRVLVSPDLPGLSGVALAERLAERLASPAVIDNDDLLAAIGEATAGSARGCRDVTFLSFGYGLGAGLLVDGRPVRGASSAAGAITYLGGRDLEARASGRGIAQRYATATSSSASSSPSAPAGSSAPAPSAVAGRPAVHDARSVFELAARGDPVASSVVGDAVAAMAELAADVAALLDPEVVVLGGGLVANGPMVFEPIAAHLASALPYPPRVVASALGDAAVVHGAVALALAHARDWIAPRRASRPGHDPRTEVALDLA